MSLIQDRCIIFQVPESAIEFGYPIHEPRKCCFKTGTFNKTLVENILLYNGVQLTTSKNFSIYWGTSQEAEHILPTLPFQNINHFPHSKLIVGDKAQFAKIMQKASSSHRFFPQSYITPKDNDELYKHMKSHPNVYWIAKPPKGSCGHGIRLVNFQDFETIYPGTVVSEYISRPLCIDGFKFDLRIYVLVTSFDPLHAFICKEGLARFASEWYSPGSSSAFSHLTNASLNKHGKNWSDEFKWTLSSLLSEVEFRWHHSKNEIFNKIQEVVSKTLLLIQPSFQNRKKANKQIYSPYFEIFGFDVLFDRDFRAWLLEINTMPALGTTEEVDFQVKAPMIAQALSIAGIPDMSFDDLLSVDESNTTEEDILRGEDKRNEMSGNGFVRLYPYRKTSFIFHECKNTLPPLNSSNSTLSEQALITKPISPMSTISPTSSSTKAFHTNSKIFQPKKSVSLSIPKNSLSENIDWTSINLSPTQGLLTLALYLTQKVQGLEHKKNDQKLETQMQSFLVAQGYKSVKGSSLMILIEHYIHRVQTWVQVANAKCVIPSDVRSAIIGMNESAIQTVLENCSMNFVHDVYLLFK